MIFDNIRTGTWVAVARRVPGFELLLQVLLPQSLKEKAASHARLTIQKLNKRLASTEDKVDFLSYILRHNDDGKGMTRPELEANSSLLIIAGSETTATHLAGTVFNLCRNTRVMEKLKAEVRGAFSNEEEITIGKANGLDYMLAVLNESARLYPAVPTSLCRYVPQPGEDICGKWVPGGVRLPTSDSKHMLRVLC